MSSDRIERRIILEEKVIEAKSGVVKEVRRGVLMEPDEWTSETGSLERFEWTPSEKGAPLEAKPWTPERGEAPKDPTQK